MTDLLRLYLQQLKTTFAAMLQYRAALAIWMIGHVLEPLVYLVVWSVAARSGDGSLGGYSPADFAAYFVVLMLVNHVTYTWIMYEYEYRVREGVLSQALLRPVHPIHADIADNLTSKLISLPGLLVAAAVMSFIFRPAFHLSPWALAAALPALMLAFLLRFLLEWTLALAAFWTTRVSALNQLYFVALLFLSGQLAPLSLLPPAVRAAAAVLPFRWMVSFPVELVLGRLSQGEAVLGLGAQAVWAVLALGLMRRVWRAGLRAYAAVGA